MHIGVMACAGRMGRALLREIIQAHDLTLVGGVERAGGAEFGRDLGSLAGCPETGIRSTADAAAVSAAADVLVEFSTPAASVDHAHLAAEHGCAHVIGTTGLEAKAIAELRRCATRTAIVFAPNMSVGVNLLQGLVRQVAATLDQEFDIEIVEMHHRRKVDAPSGTALALGHAAALGRGIELDGNAARARDGVTGPRAPGAIGFAVLRGGDVVGDHQVIFAGSGERLVLGHIATDRAIYAKGALRAARWAVGQAPGLYSMADVLGLG